MSNPSELNERPRPKPQQPTNQNEPIMHQNGGGHHNPRQHTMESVQGQQGMTAEQLKRQIEQSVEAKLENKGVNQTVNNMNKMVTRPNGDFEQQQRLASVAVASAIKAHANDDIMRNGTAKTFAKTLDNTQFGDEAFIKPLAKQSVEFGVEKDVNTKLSGQKTLSSQPRAEKPMSHGTLNASVSDKMIQKESDGTVVHLGTSETDIAHDINNTPNLSTDSEIESSVSEPEALSGKINVFFVPNLGDESEISKNDVKLSYLASNGESKQIVSSKFRPVVYLKDEDAAGYNVINMPGIKVKEGYTQVDALDFAKKNNVELKDIAGNDNFVKMSHHAFETPNPSCIITKKKYISGKDVNPFATSQRDMTLNIPVITYEHEIFNAYEYELASSMSGANVISVDKVLDNIYASSLEKDKAANPDIYRDADAFHDRCINKSKIIKDKSLDNTTKKEKLKQLDIDFANAQKQYYADRGLTESSIDHLEKLGYIGIDSVRFKTHVSPSHDFSKSMQDISLSNHKIIENAGKFTVNSDSKDTNFGRYLMQHKEDILGYIGDKLGTSDEDMHKQTIHISTQSVSNNVSTCVVIYEGFEDQNIDSTVREVVGDVLKEYGDKHATISDKSYSVEKDEIDYCNSKYGNITAEYAVPKYGSIIEEQVHQEPQTTLDEFCYDVAKDENDYYDRMVQGMSM